MFGLGSRVQQVGMLADQAYQNAQRGLALTEKHMAECVLRHSEVQKTLTKQDETLDSIKALVGRTMLTALTLLVTVIGWALASSFHISITP